MADSAAALLLRHGLVTPEQVAAAHKLRQRDGGSFGECLVRLRVVDEEQLVAFYHRRCMIQRVADAKLMIISPKVLALVPPDMAAEFRVVPIDIDAEGTLTLAMADPTDNHAVDEIAFFADRFIVRTVATETAVRRAIETHYGVTFTSPPASQPAAAPRAQPAPPSPKPTREALEQQIVLLTKVKRSEETPLPIPVPPPEDYAPRYIPDEPSEPILLTKPKSLPRDTAPQLLIPTPDPPLAELRAARGRDDIGHVVLDYVGLLCRRAIFFVVRKELLVGHDVRGEALDEQSARELAINIEAPSIFRDVIASRLPYRGPLPDTAANRTFARLLGGVDGDVLLMPIAVRERIIAVLYADRANQPLPDAALHAVVREAGLAYERLILSAKGDR